MKFDKPIYTLDWHRLVLWLLPIALRKPKLLAWLYAVTSCVNDLHSRFIMYKNSTSYKLSITPQVCSLEKVLNDRYDIIARRIKIMDGIEYAALPLFLKIEDKQLKLFTKKEGDHVTLYTKKETGIYTTDFIVKVPKDIFFDTNEMIALVNSYKLASKTFTIQKF